jgi:hypothetical protein
MLFTGQLIHTERETARGYSMVDKRFWSGAIVFVTLIVAGSGALPELLLRPVSTGPTVVLPLSAPMVEPVAKLEPTGAVANRAPARAISRTNTIAPPPQSTPPQQATMETARQAGVGSRGSRGDRRTAETGARVPRHTGSSPARRVPPRAGGRGCGAGRSARCRARDASGDARKAGASQHRQAGPVRTDCSAPAKTRGECSASPLSDG